MDIPDQAEQITVSWPIVFHRIAITFVYFIDLPVHVFYKKKNDYIINQYLMNSVSTFVSSLFYQSNVHSFPVLTIYGTSNITRTSQARFRSIKHTLCSFLSLWKPGNWRTESLRNMGIE